MAAASRTSSASCSRSAIVDLWQIQRGGDSQSRCEDVTDDCVMGDHDAAIVLDACRHCSSPWLAFGPSRRVRNRHMLTMDAVGVESAAIYMHSLVEWLRFRGGTHVPHP